LVWLHKKGSVRHCWRGDAVVLCSSHRHVCACCSLRAETTRSVGWVSQRVGAARGICVLRDALMIKSHSGPWLEINAMCVSVGEARWICGCVRRGSLVSQSLGFVPLVPCCDDSRCITRASDHVKLSKDVRIVQLSRNVRRMRNIDVGSITR
jgi:hypothetical protein